MSTPPWNSARPCSTAQPVQMKDMLQFYAFPESIECATHLDQRLHGIHVQVIAGLIQQQQVGLAERHTRHGHPVLLATCRSSGGGSRGAHRESRCGALTYPAPSTPLHLCKQELSLPSRLPPPPPPPAHALRIRI